MNNRKIRIILGKAFSASRKLICTGPPLVYILISIAAISERMNKKSRCINLIQVAVFEPTQMACEVLSRAIEASSDDIRVITTGVSSQFKNDAELKKASVAVISQALKDDNVGGLKLLRRLTKERPNLNCVLLLDEDDIEVVVEAFRSGAVGVCERDKSCDYLCKCIRCVNEGQVWASSRQLRYALEALAKGLPPFITDSKGQILLSRRELEIVSKVAEGMRNREIAELLHVSEHTIKNHLFRIFDRLGISSRAELILYLHSQKYSAAEDKESA